MADLIDRQAALKELAVYIHLIDKTMGKGTLTDDDCMEAAKSVLGEDELPAVQPDHNADIGKKVADEDCISRQAAIEALARMMPRSYTPDGSHPADEEIFRAQEVIADCIEALEILPSAQPENQVHLCDSCRHVYPECPSEKDDVIFGNGKGNDNICACNKYEPSAQPEVIRCKECKHFEHDHPYIIQGILILGHEVCNAWGDGYRTDANGYCFLAERRTDSDGRD